jgi:peptidoglycan/LPS O-acetylase OafA/YrhL
MAATQQQQPPASHPVPALCLGVYGALLAWLVYAMGLDDRSPGGVAFRGAVACAGALAWIAAEAMLRGRPWAFRAARALTLCTALGILVSTVVSLASGHLGPALVEMAAAVFVAVTGMAVIDDAQTGAPQRWLSSHARGRLSP